MKIYTKKGDNGTTGLIGGARVPKNNIRVEAYGTVDELNSFMGLLRFALRGENRQTVEQIQNVLFVIGSHLASIPGAKMQLPEITDKDVSLLEIEIDRLTSSLPELRSFILPGGSHNGSYAHIARCVCRRAERLAVAISETEPVEELILKYLNRLSDYLFTLARFLDNTEGEGDLEWKP